MLTPAAGWEVFNVFLGNAFTFAGRSGHQAIPGSRDALVGDVLHFPVSVLRVNLKCLEHGEIRLTSTRRRAGFSIALDFIRALDGFSPFPFAALPSAGRR